MKNPLCIFCGGSSRRMGRDKARLMLVDETLLERQIRRAEASFDEILLLSGPNRYDVTLRQIPDAMDDAGPLSGLLVALEDACLRHSQIAVLPVDVPFLSLKTLKTLSEAGLSDQEDGLLLRSDDRVQPLAGVYNTNVASQLRTFLENGQRMVMKFVESLRIDYLDVDEEELRNINFPGDFKQIQK
jgi:molybdenum cofactor guanylyltransferase